MNSPWRLVYPLYGAATAARVAVGAGQELAMRWPREELLYGSIHDGIQCILPSSSDWSYLQPSETTDPEDWWDPLAHLPWPCLVVTEAFFKAAGQPWDESDLSFGNCAAADAVRALLLVKNGWFMDPVLSEIIYDSGYGLLRRRLAAYRTIYHDEDASRFRPPSNECYEIRANDFTQHAMPSAIGGQVGSRGSPETRLGATFEILRRHRERPVSSAEIAIEAYSRSHGLLLSMGQQLMLLTLAFEATMGSWRGGAPRSVPKRLDAVIRLAGSEAGDDASTWFDAVVIPLRNDVSHGRDIENAEHRPTILRLRSIMRPLIFQYLVFSQRWRSEISAPAVSSERSSGCRDAYATSLDRVIIEGSSGEAGRLLGLP